MAPASPAGGSEPVVVLGASGFIGGTLWRGLSAMGRSVVGVDLLPPLSMEGGDASRWVTADLGDEESWAGLPARAEWVINAAALVGNPPGATPREHWLANAWLAHRAAIYASAVGARLLFLSTGGVYGYGRGPADESTPPAPPDAYNLTKLAGELACRHLFPADRLLILRLYFPYGPGQCRGLLPTLRQRIVAGEPVRLNDVTGSPRISPIFLDDLLVTIDRALSATLTGCFNCAGPETVTIRELAVLLGTVLGLEVRFSSDDKPCGDLIGDASRLAAVLGWAPAVPLSEGLRRFAEG